MEFLTIKCQILHTHIGTLDTSEAAFWYFLPHSMMNLGNNLFDGYGFLALDVIEKGRFFSNANASIRGTSFTWMY